MALYVVVGCLLDEDLVGLRLDRLRCAIESKDLSFVGQVSGAKLVIHALQ